MLSGFRPELDAVLVLRISEAADAAKARHRLKTNFCTYLKLLIPMILLFSLPHSVGQRCADG